MSEQYEDPVIDSIRAIRHRISAQFDHDPYRLAAHYMELQKRYVDRLLVDGHAGKVPPQAERPARGE